MMILIVLIMLINKHGTLSIGIIFGLNFVRNL